MSTSPNPSRIPRSPSPSLPPPPTSAKLPPRPSASTTQHVPYSRQSLGPGLSSAALPGGLVNPPGSARNFSGPARAVGGGRPVSEILGGGLGVPGGGGNADMRSPEAEAIDRWFQDLASYEVTLEEMAAASLDQNFTEELSAIEQWFRVLSEAERTAALYSLLQHSTQVQIRFFMTVLQQMARSDPMTALLSPAIGGGMQAQMEAKLANLNLRSPNRTSFGGVPPSATRDSFGGGNDHPSSYLTPESALANAGEGPVAPSPRSVSSSSANNKASHRISAPGTLNGLSPSWAGAGQLDQVLERGPSPSAESVSSARSNLNNDVRPKSTDFTGLANGPPGSATFARSPRLGNNGNGNGDDVTFPLSPNGVGGNWASMVNTPAVPMFATNHSTIQDHPAFSSLASSVPKLSEAPKRRSSAKMSMGGGGNNLYNEDGELVGQKSSQQQQQQHAGRGLQSPGALGGGFQGAGAGAWSRSPGLGNDHLGGAGFPNNFGLGVGGLGGVGGFAGLGSPSPSDIAFQMSQLQLQQLQLQQLQQLQQLGVNNGGGIGMGLPMMAGLGMGMNGPGGLGFGQAPRSASLRSQSGYSANGAGGKRSPMMGMGGNVNKSPSPGGRRESSGVGAGPEEDTDIRVLEDIPQWLRTLRLHKYTPNFEGAKWRDMVLMGDSDLEAKGVAALGARRKLLKTFELVRAQYGIAEPAGSTANGGGENVAISSSASGDDEDVKR